jgi:hypothetical protein
MRPHAYHGRHQAPSAYAHVQPAQAHATVQYEHPHASIEASTPPAFSSLRVIYDQVSDTSSDSSGSRESSTCPRGSAWSTTATNGGSTHSTRTKRGSESQGSGSDRSIKRPDSSKGELWCTDCECAVADCTSPKVHKARVKKIVKEKSSRSTQASILQSHEDLTQNALNIIGYKIQQPGNKKKSGMEYDKKEVLASSHIFMDESIQTIASFGPQILHDFLRRTGDRVQHHIVHGSAQELPADSLMSGPDGEGPCLHEISNTKCESLIECRKRCRSVHYKNKINQILESAPCSGAHQLSAGSRSSSSTLRRR